MSTPNNTAAPARPLDLSKWRTVPNIAIGIGVVLTALTAFTNYRQFSFSWLLAFMFYLSLVLGGLFLVIVHHLFDAGWSTPIRRTVEHIACLAFPWMAIFFLPILLNVLFAGPENLLYEWMKRDAHTDHALHAKQPLFTKAGFYIVTAACFLIWTFLSRRFRSLSIAQDASGAAGFTRTMRFHAAWGAFGFALTLSLAAIMWMKALTHEWFSTMYGVYYFAGSVWLTLATVYVITMVLQRTGTLTAVLHEHQFYFLGSLFFAFTVFYAYIHFSQYFIIWNANLPEETFWYQLREQGTWWDIGLVIIFGHFLVPFLGLLRIDAKVTFWWMVPLCAWAWLMHFADLSFNIMPVLHPGGFVLHYADLGTWALIGGVLAKVWLKDFADAAPYPLRDPRIKEAAGHYRIVSQISGGELDETDGLVDGGIHTKGSSCE
ncbi:MAG: hypothetical protein HZA90_28280 [Verrucomicrobia bacterium]|nr:hypothetical protein [Verrucomicrobiota bacterium]